MGKKSPRWTFEAMLRTSREVHVKSLWPVATVRLDTPDHREPYCSAQCSEEVSRRVGFLFHPAVLGPSSSGEGHVVRPSLIVRSPNMSSSLPYGGVGKRSNQLQIMLSAHSRSCAAGLQV